MFGFNVCSEVALDASTVGAQGTLVRFLPGVYPNMALQLGPARRPPAAVRTSDPSNSSSKSPRRDFFRLHWRQFLGSGFVVRGGESVHRLQQHSRPKGSDGGRFGRRRRRRV